VSDSPQDYTAEHAASGIGAELPGIACWPNQYAGYEIRISVPEFTSVCPKTGLPDFGTLTLTYRPDRQCMELKSLKEYFLAYRSLGIFYENVVNRVLEDIVAACSPVSAEVVGEFNARGGLRAVVTARYPKAGE
jgi:7-cyano-7-deazaguanine reductase